jgi:hypothetical protein
MTIKGIAVLKFNQQEDGDRAEPTKSAIALSCLKSTNELESL